MVPLIPVMCSHWDHRWKAVEQNDGFRPMELLAIGLAGCTGMDVISILKKKRQE